MSATAVPRDMLLHVVKVLPSAPQILAQLGELLLDMNSGLDEITALLKRDGALTTRIIRISNSAIYNSGTPFASIEESLARVGFTEVYRLTGFAAAAQLSDRMLALYGITGAQLRENSLLTALVMEALAEISGAEPRAAYTAGLLRSTGKIALDRLTRDGAYAGSYNPRFALAEWEDGFVGLDNCEAAAIILKEWRFPNQTTSAIQQHYAPAASSLSLAHLLTLAAGAAERSGSGLVGEQSYWEPTPARLAAAGVDEEQLTDATKLALERFGPVRAAMA